LLLAWVDSRHCWPGWIRDAVLAPFEIAKDHGGQPMNAELGANQMKPPVGRGFLCPGLG
jgi:hypothetical protein